MHAVPLGATQIPPAHWSPARQSRTSSHAPPAPDLGAHVPCTQTSAHSELDAQGWPSAFLQAPAAQTLAPEHSPGVGSATGTGAPRPGRQEVSVAAYWQVPQEVVRHSRVVQVASKHSHTPLAHCASKLHVAPIPSRGTQAFEAQ